MKADPVLPLYREQHGARAGQGRLEILTALIGSPAFNPLLRQDVIRFPPRHPVFGWACLVTGCERARGSRPQLCSVHYEQWLQAQARGEGMAAFLAGVRPLGPDDAIALIHQTSRGYPRTVNNLALQALLAPFAASKAIVDESSARRRDGSNDRMKTLPTPRTPSPAGHRPGRGFLIRFHAHEQ